MGRTLTGRLIRLIPLAVLVLGLALRAADLPIVQELRDTAFDQFQRLDPREYDPAMPVKVIDIDEDRIGVTTVFVTHDQSEARLASTLSWPSPTACRPPP